MHISSLSISGLKGNPFKVDLAERSLFVGPNGAGKTRIRDAVDFLLGRDTAGVGVDGSSLRALLSDDSQILVGATLVVDDGAFKIERVREVKRDGGLARSKVYIDGEEDRDGRRLGEIVGRLDAPAGAEWLDLSVGALTKRIALVGIFVAAERFAADLNQAAAEIKAYGGGRLMAGRPGLPIEPLALLGAVHSIAGGEVNAARKYLRGLDAATDRSREEVGTGVDPEDLPRLKATRDSCSDTARAAGQELATAREAAANATRNREANERELASVRSRISGHQGMRKDLKRADDAPPPGALAEAKKHVDQLAAKVETAASTVRKWRTAKEQAGTAYADATLAVNQERSVIAALGSEIDALIPLAAALDDAPCTAASAWIDGDDFTGGAPPVDLADACPLLVAARAASALLAPTRRCRADAEASRLDAARVFDAARKETDEAGEALRLAERGADATGALLVAARRALDSVREAAEVADPKRKEAERTAIVERIAELGSRRDVLLSNLDTLGAAFDEAEVSVDESLVKLNTANETHKAAVDAYDTANVRAEQLRRLVADREAAAEAEGRVGDAKMMLGRVEALMGRIKETGEGSVLDHAAPFVPTPWALAFRDGRVGLRDADDRFWYGPALSSAQRALVAFAIDRALDALDDRRFRIAFVEADPLDDANRAHVLDQLNDSVSSGAVSQALVFQCSEPGGAASNAWHIFYVAPQSKGAPEAKRQKEADPFDPFNPLAPSAPGFDPFKEPPPAPTRPPGVEGFVAGADDATIEAILRGLFSRKKIPTDLTRRRGLLKRLAAEEKVTADGLANYMAQEADADDPA